MKTHCNGVLALCVGHSEAPHSCLRAPVSITLHPEQFTAHTCQWRSLLVFFYLKKSLSCLYSSRIFSLGRAGCIDRRLVGECFKMPESAVLRSLFHWILYSSLAASKLSVFASLGFDYDILRCDCLWAPPAECSLGFLDLSVGSYC